LLSFIGHVVLLACSVEKSIGVVRGPHLGDPARFLVRALLTPDARPIEELMDVSRTNFGRYRTSSAGEIQIAARDRVS
jgi:hypothetical protein